MTSHDGKFLVFTREGASDRKNGIVDLLARRSAAPEGRSPSSPTASPPACIRSFVNTQDEVRHASSTSPTTARARCTSSTSTTRTIRSKSRVWKTKRPDAGRSLHDIDVRDGLLYASYWNDGLVILDIGNGIKGGSPSNPTARVAVQVRPQRAVQAGRGRRRPGLHPRHAHGVAAQELRLHRRRGLSGELSEEREGSPRPAARTAACRCST